MEEETKRRFRKLFQEQMRAAELPEPEDAAKLTRAVLKGDSLKEAEVFPNVTILVMYERFEHYLGILPEPTPQESNKLEAELKQMVYKLRNQVLATGKKFPHDPGGAPKKLSAEQKKRASKLVGQLMGEGDTYAEAVANIAQRFQV